MSEVAQYIVEEVRLPDGASVGIRRFGNEGRAAIVCTAAMGVEAGFYTRLALALQSRGYQVFTVDNRGLGLSSVEIRRGVDHGFREVAEVDMPAVVKWVREGTGDRPLVLLGHSLGGQLNCLYAAGAPVKPDALVLLTCCSVYWGSFQWPMNFGLWLFGFIARGITEALGFWPGKVLRFGRKEPLTLTRDWTHQCRTGRYEPRGSRVDYEARLAELELPVLAISFTDDTYAPKEAVDHLLRKMPAAATDHLHIDPEELGVERLSHFDWAKRPDPVVPTINAWLEAVLASLAVDPSADSDA
jgi:predicted alpha/beta hydrolase